MVWRSAATQCVAFEPTDSVRGGTRCIDLSEATEPETRSDRPLRGEPKHGLEGPRRAGDEESTYSSNHHDGTLAVTALLVELARGAQSAQN